ncbi:hypothetical protein K491DRAFT_777638 [Lophiostoma macrostomum CBS 122681]|uniref:Uncharacterized protein n=1 Tax=Lophiostoma macrostomum CBS 122681 TaxID=1314788 RepID=A0A6A6TAX7_9PLEO|nr:hypothetical protein K491DRAFT_777638 [Lophiostoma macrostomum CBS 122681]
MTVVYSSTAGSHDHFKLPPNIQKPPLETGSQHIGDLETEAQLELNCLHTTIMSSSQNQGNNAQGQNRQSSNTQQSNTEQYPAQGNQQGRPTMQTAGAEVLQQQLGMYYLYLNNTQSNNGQNNSGQGK